jgi:hypothetical protein
MAFLWKRLCYEWANMIENLNVLFHESRQPTPMGGIIGQHNRSILRTHADSVSLS